MAYSLFKLKSFMVSAEYSDLIYGPAAVVLESGLDDVKKMYQEPFRCLRPQS